MADPSSTALGRLLLDEITPTVMVLRTPLVEEACLKNGLSFVQMLSPFCVFNNIDVPVRTSSDQPYRLQKFKLRLFYASDIHQPNIEGAKNRVRDVITHAGEGHLNLSSEPVPIENLLTTSQSEILPSWFQFFNKEMIRATSFSDHETFDHPVACLLVVSSKDEQPINRFFDIFNADQLPSFFNAGVTDPNILKSYLLVHDSQDGLPDKASKIFTEMRNTFGSNDCRFLCINSSQNGSVDLEDSPWAISETDPSPNKHHGRFLSIDDLSEIKDLMQDLSSKHIIPHMEQKVRMLNQQVSATRKGFKNQIKNLWWRKGKEDTPEEPNGPMYVFSSIESQIRVLGDYAFMLRDYELALSNYRLLSTDYKLDKAWKRYAGVQEMTGLTYFMLDQSRKEAEYCMENALTTYQKIGSFGMQNAIRCGLWWAEMLKTRDQFKEAASVYLRISGEEPLHSAVMLEQASYCYLFSRPPMLRKYGFHLVLSGDIYRRCDQIKHAIRTYRSALSVYKGTAWSRVNDHVHFHMGKWYAFLGMFDVAVAHMLEVLACSQQSRTTQELFLREFLQIVQKTGKTFEVSRLQLPVVNMPSLKVIFEDHRTYASPAAVAVRESLWQTLEEDVIPSTPFVKTNWLESQPKLNLKKYKESNICVAGEAIKVNIEFKNLLQIPISVSSVSLICELSAKSDETESDATSSATEIQNDEELKKITTSSMYRDPNSGGSVVTLSEVDFSLGGGEMIVVQLTVTPRVEGNLKIVGVKWKLSGSVVGFCNFDSSLLKKKVFKGRRKPKHSPNDYLNFVVIKNLPKLEGSIRHLPKKVYMGDLRCVVLELRNQSEVPVENMKMKISHPRFLGVGNHEVLNMDFPACLEKKTNTEQNCEQFDCDKVPKSLFSFPETASVQGGSHLLWPLWLRGAVPGNISLYITIYYEVGGTSDVMKYRTLRMHYNLEVLPSLDVSFHISPCPSRLQEFIVRMDVVNRTSSESFQVLQLSSVGFQWEMLLLQTVDTIFPSKFLTAGQVLSCFFKLKNGRRLEFKETDASLIHHRGSDLKFSVSSVSGQLFDISSSPLADFHHYERLKQEASHQEHPVTVDFILITQPQSSSTSDPGLPGPSTLLSHHACHCSVASTSPIWWLMDGPRNVTHNFSVSFCEIKLKVIVHNPSDVAASVRINTFDSTNRSSQPRDPVASPSASPSLGTQIGWHDFSTANDTTVTFDGTVSGLENRELLESVPPFIWSGSSSNIVDLEPMSRVEIQLQICVFSPGTYDLSDYVLHWDFLPSNGKENHGADTIQSSGTCPGHPYYLTVLQSQFDA